MDRKIYTGDLVFRTPAALVRERMAFFMAEGMSAPDAFGTALGELVKAQEGLAQTLALHCEGYFGLDDWTLASKDA